MMKAIQIHRRATAVDSHMQMLFVKNCCQTWVDNLEGRGGKQSDTNPTVV